MDRKDFWDITQPAYGPMLTKELIALAECKLNVRLPQLLINLLNIKNGGTTLGFALPMIQKTIAGDYLAIEELYGITNDSFLSKPNLLHSSYLIKEWGLPEKQVLILGEGHWWVTLDYRVGEEPTVNWIDAENRQDFILAPTFEAFMSRLETIEKYRPLEQNNRVANNTVIWESFIAEEKLIELDERFLKQVNERRRQKGLPDIKKE